MPPLATEKKSPPSGSSRPTPAAASAGPWLEALRQTARDRFASVGYPASTLEEWRFTNLAPIARTRFAPAPPQAGEEARALANQAGFHADALAELVFVNGHYIPSLSRSGKLPRGATLGTLAQALATDSNLLQPHLGRLADSKTIPLWR